MQNYNFVIFQKHFDYYRIAYSDIIKRSDVKYIDKIKIHRSKTINAILRTPIKNLLPAGYFKTIFPTTKPLCFIFGARWMQYLSMQDYILYLRKHFPDAKFVCFNQDVVKYGLTYHSTVFSNYPVEIDAELLKQDNHFINPYKNEIGPNSLLEFISSSFTEERIHIQNN